MKLGNFSVSLAVKDLAASKTFYEKLGFAIFHDQSAHNWMILKNGNATIGLFQGMFEGNILTFNPGWDENGQPVEEYMDVRDIQKQAQAAGIDPVKTNVDSLTGPGNCVFVDPDGNTILIDQHV